MRRTAVAPATVNVPVMVWLLSSSTVRRPAAEGAVIERLLKVLDWLMVAVEVLVNDTS